jgi:two-component system, cell cycle sensor histidine kinase and response regulator CckA
MQGNLRDPHFRPKDGILIVDDEPAIRELAAMVLDHAGYRTFRAGNGQEGIELFCNLQSQIRGVLTDVNMPIINGFGLVRAIRAIAPHTKIIFSSGSLGEAEKRIAADLRVNAFIAKPWTAPQLASCVDSILKSQEELVGVECASGAGW